MQILKSENQSHVWHIDQLSCVLILQKKRIFQLPLSGGVIPCCTVPSAILSHQITYVIFENYKFEFHLHVINYWQLH
jgi:hypothetical protein